MLLFYCKSPQEVGRAVCSLGTQKMPFPIRGKIACCVEVLVLTDFGTWFLYRKCFIAVFNFVDTTTSQNIRVISFFSEQVFC